MAIWKKTKMNLIYEVKKEKYHILSKKYSPICGYKTKEENPELPFYFAGTHLLENNKRVCNLCSVINNYINNYINNKK